MYLKYPYLHILVIAPHLNRAPCAAPPRLSAPTREERAFAREFKSTTMPKGRKRAIKAATADEVEVRTAFA